MYCVPFKGLLGRSGLPGADGLPGPPGTVLMLPVSKFLLFKQQKKVVKMDVLSFFLSDAKSFSVV